MSDELTVRLKVGKNNSDRYACPVNLRTENPGLCYRTFKKCPYLGKLTRDARECEHVKALEHKL